MSLRAMPAPGHRRLTAVLAALVAALILAGCSSSPQSQNVPDSGYVSGDGSVESWAPEARETQVDLSGQSYDEEAIDLTDWRGEVVVVNFWYAACPPCRKEAPDLVELSEEYAAHGVEFLGVNHTDDVGTAQAFERTFGIEYPSLHDDEAAGVAAMQGVVPLRAMPTTVVLDREGQVAARILGLADPSTLRALIDEVLDEE